MKDQTNRRLVVVFRLVLTFPPQPSAHGDPDEQQSDDEGRDQADKQIFIGKDIRHGAWMLRRRVSRELMGVRVRQQSRRHHTIEKPKRGRGPQPRRDSQDPIPEPRIAVEGPEDAVS